jgi:transposase-like protein
LPALDHRLNANILFRWRRHYLRELEGAGQQAAGALLPVTVREMVPEFRTGS